MKTTMTEQRRNYLKQYCHDEIIRIETNISCGKLIPDLPTIIELFKILEEVIGSLEVS